MINTVSRKATSNAKGVVVALGCAAMIMASTSAWAVTATGSLGVSITLSETCAVASVVPVTFPASGVLNAVVNATGSFTVQCTNGTDYSVGLGVGTAPSATVAARGMRVGAAGAQITYSLYTDAGHTSVWGNTPPTDTVAGIADGTPISYTVYGQVPIQTTPVPGTYTDTVVINVVY